MAAIQGLRGTGEFSVDFRPKNYRELFTLLEPNGTAPLQALLSMASAEETNDPEFKHFRDELPNRTVTVPAGATNVASSITLGTDVDNTNFVMPGTILVNPATGEAMRVTAYNTGTNAATITRGLGGSGIAIAANQVLTIAGFADAEAGNSSTPVSFDATVQSNYTQIFKTSVALSETLNNTFLRTGSKEQEMLMKALKLHMGDIERAFFFGVKSETNGSTSQPLRTTGGLFSMIPNVIDAATNPYGDGVGKIAEKSFDRALVENIFAFGSNEKVAFCGPKVIGHIHELCKARWAPQQVSGSYGVSMSRYSTMAGDLLVQAHPMFRQIPALNDAMVILDMSHVKYRYMKGRDTKLQKNVHAPDFDGVKHQYLTEAGLELTQGKVHTLIKGWETTAS